LRWKSLDLEIEGPGKIIVRDSEIEKSEKPQNGTKLMRSLNWPEIRVELFS